jgi:uncharacterized protein YjbJ (UPF0337 family)
METAKCVVDAEGVRHMGISDKAKNTAEDLTGKGKEGVGEATGDDKMKAEGQNDQAKANLKKAGENVKDAFKG